MNKKQQYPRPKGACIKCWNINLHIITNPDGTCPRKDQCGKVSTNPYSKENFDPFWP
jgi:hypothetical protein